MILASLLVAQGAMAGPSGLALQGRLMKNGVPVEHTVDVTIKVTSIATPSVTPECVLYEETHTINLVNSDGLMNLQIGGGTRTANDKGLSLISVFSNKPTAITGLSCTGTPSATSYTPQATDTRNVYLSFVDGSDTVVFSSPFVIQSTPYAFEAERLAGLSSTDLLQVTTNTTQTKLNDLMTPAHYTELLALINGTSSSFTSFGGGDLNYSSGKLFVDHTNGEVGIGTSTPSGTLDVRGGTASAGTAGTNITITAQGGGTGNTAGGNILLKAGGASGSGVVGAVGIGVLASDDISSVGQDGLYVKGSIYSASGITAKGGAINAGAQGTAAGSGGEVRFSELAANGTNYVGFRAPDALGGNKIWTLPSADGSNGDVLTTNGSGVLSWVAASGGGGSGAVSNSASLANGKIWIGDGSGKAQEQTLSSDVTITNAGVATVAKIQGVAISSTAPTADGQVLRYSGTQYQGKFLTVADLHSSVGPGYAQAFPSTSCTAGQTLTWSSITDTLSCTNISVSTSQITGLGTAAALNVGVGNNNIVQLDGSSKMPAVDGSALMTLNASNIASGTLNASRLPATAVLDGGNAPTATMSIGSTSSQALELKTGNSARLTIDTSGNIGVGTASANQLLTVEGVTSLRETTAPSATANYGKLYVKSSDSKLYFMDDSGTEKDLTAASGGGGSSQWTTSGSDIYYTTGKVGIGTSTFSSKLVVKGSSGSPASTGTTQNGIFRIEQGDTNNVMDFGSIMSSPYATWIQSANRTALGTNNPLALNPNGGNVGIGTTDPQATLDINGYARLKPNSSAPASCSGSNTGAIALTSAYTLCVCKGPANAWKSVNDGSTNCTW